jgi:hypothetical protein
MRHLLFIVLCLSLMGMQRGVRANETEGEHGGSDKKQQAFQTSKLYDPSIIKLNAANHPFTEIVQSNPYADYYLCRDTVNAAYRDTVLNEMNRLSDRMGLPHAQESPCMVKVAKPTTSLPGAVFIEFYVDEPAARQCMIKGECGATRLVMLYINDKNGTGYQDIYRSYVITDEHKTKRASFCISPGGRFLGEKSCYVALNPDWLFN